MCEASHHRMAAAECWQLYAVILPVRISLLSRNDLRFETMYPVLNDCAHTCYLVFLTHVRLVHASGSGSDTEEDHHPLKLSMWRKEEHGSSSESFQSSDKGRSRSRKHKKEKDKPHSRSGHHHHHHRHQRHHNSDGKGAERKSSVESQDKTLDKSLGLAYETRPRSPERIS